MSRTNKPDIRSTDHLLATVTGINLKSTGQTVLYTVPDGKTLIPTKIVIRITSSSAPVSGATVTVGVGGGFDSISTTVVTGLLSVGQYGIISPLAITGTGSKICSSGDVIKLNVSVGATATTLTAACDILGYLI